MKVAPLLAAATMTIGCPLALGAGDTSAGARVGTPWNQGVTARCAPLYSVEWRPQVEKDRRPKATMSKPRRGVAFADPVYRTCVVRVTDHAADRVGEFARSDYSRRQAFNADDSRIVVAASDGSWHLYDANDSRHLGKLSGVGGDAEPQWHPTNPDLLYYFPGFGIGMRIHELDVRSGRTRVVADLAARIRRVWPAANSAWTKSEGSPSADGRYWALMVDDVDWRGLGMLTYDLARDRVIAIYDFTTHRKDRPDHVSMSPSGQYVVASWDDGVYAFSRDLSNERKLHPRGEHSDLAVGAEGDDVYVSIDYQDPGGHVFMRNLRTGERTDLFPTYLEGTATAIHFSGKAFGAPGWVLASTYAEYGGAPQWLHGKVFAIQLSRRPRIVTLAHHHSIYNEYWTEPHASVNRNFTRVVFGSNWDSGSKTDVDTYLIELPKTAIGSAGR